MHFRSLRCMEFIVINVVLTLSFTYVSGSCTWPDYFLNSQWVDSNKGQLTFTTNQMSGWSFQVNTGATRNSWRCHSTDWLQSDGYLILITTDVFAPFGSDFYGYLCLKLISITDNSYRYYQYNPEQPQLYNERVLMDPSNSLTDKATLCLESAPTFRPSDSEYKLLIRSDDASAAKVQCTYVFLGKYDYVHTTSSGTTSCDTSSDVMDTCTDSTQMTFDYSTCSTQIAYSVSNTVWCVDNVEYNGNNYISLYNGNDADSSIDDVTIFRFTCLAVSNDAMNASITPNSCKKGQVPHSIPTNVQTGSTQGALLQLSQLESCETCPLLSPPQSGSVSYTTNGAVTTALYACDAQYSLAGDASRICQSNLTWSSQQPTCTCILPTPPNNGSVSASNDGTTLVYTCNVGFVLNGDENRTCQSSSNSWTGTDPTCDACDEFGDVSGLNWTLSLDGTTTVAAFTCDTNYTLNGSTNGTCLSTGNWSIITPICVLCDSLSAPSSGTVAFSTDGYMTTAMFGCVSGYHLVGVSSVTCSVSGVWNGPAPTCECDDPASPSNGTIAANGTRASYTCDTGFTLIGDSELTCAVDGSGWQGTTPSCGACQSLADPIGGFVNFSSGGIVTLVTYSCLVGYTLNGERASYCQVDGTWNVTAPNCALCSNLTNPSSGSVALWTDGTTTQAAYTCVTNYTLIGDNTSVCDTSGTWTTVPPNCLCAHVTVPGNGNVVYNSDNTTAYYSCMLGYSLSGSSVRTCGTDGSGWSGVDRTCEECAALNNVTGGDYSLSTNTVNTLADFTCNVGYTINGTARLTCQQNGAWDHAQPTCSSCDNVTTSTGGHVTFSTSGTVTQATFTCDAGYTINGTPTLTCDESGNWDFTTPTCAKCTDRQAPSSGTINITTDGAVTVATYACSTGYAIIGQSTVTCLPDGNWNLPEPTCKCNIPTAPSNGNVTVSGDYVTFNCDVGFTMSGDAMGTCQTDGSGWNISTPSCTSCDTLPNGSGGNLTYISDGVTTQATYTCNVGSSLNGTQTVTCNENGTWAATQPECVTCPILSNTVDSGNVSLATNGSITMATYTCLPGYSIKGSSVLTCTGDGNWDSSEPTCVCDPFSAPASGSVLISDDGLTASFGCDVGYTINGDVNISCGSGGSGWTVAEPTCTQCGNLTNPDGGEVTYVSTGSQTSAVYNCSIGSTLAGPVQQPTCQTDGSWDFTNFTCVTCPTDVLNLTNGEVIQSTDGQTTVITYNCSPGYDLVGDVNLTCLSSGLYDNSVPVCYCTQPPAPVNGAVTVSADRSVATYNCSSGYILRGVASRVCQNNSLGWSDAAPTCNSCDSLTVPSGVSFTLTTNGTVTTALFFCSLGYTLNGTSEISCLDDGTWSHSVPLCVKCPDLPSINSGNVTLDTDGIITTAMYTCVPGYYAVGSTNQSCQATGVWDDVQPRCVCDGLQSPSNGLVNVTADLITVSFECNLGYTLNGVAEVTCGSDGSGWSANSPSCVTCPNITGTSYGQYQTVSNGTVSSIEYTCDAGSSLDGSAQIDCQSDGSWSSTESTCVQCPTLEGITSGNVTITTDGLVTMATYTCYQGYSAIGLTSRTCLTNGTWSEDKPYCVCDAPPNITNGEVSLETNNTLVAYTCDVYYTLSGSRERSCLQDGTGWNGSEPTCVGCPSLTAPTNGSVNITTDGGQTTASFECDLGTTLQGQMTSTCGIDGQWSNSVPQCVSCGPPANINSGNYTMFTNGTTTVVTYVCSSNYRLSGSVSVICKSDSLWNTAFPSCLCEDPSKPVDGSITSDGATVQYSCNSGYTINGDTVRSCDNAGSGWSGSDPNCTLCQGLISPSGGSYVISTNGTMSSATFECTSGTTMNGTRLLVCLSDGSWDSTTPNCVTCDPLTPASNGVYNYSTDGVTTSVDLQCNTGYETSGTSSVTCQSDGTWDLQQTLTCQKTAVPSDDDADSLLPVLIGVSVGATVIIIILSLLLARFMYLYFRGSNVLSYTPRSNVTDSKEFQPKSSKISHFDQDPVDEPYTIPLVKLTPAAAPMGHQHHVLDKGPLASSPAPMEHGSSIFDSGMTPRSPASSVTGYSPRSLTSVSTLSLGHVKPNMLPPIKPNTPTKQNTKITKSNAIKTNTTKPSFVSENTDILTFSGPSTPLPTVFKTPKKTLVPSPSPILARPSTPVNHTLSVMDAEDTPRENGRPRSQTPVNL